MFAIQWALVVCNLISCIPAIPAFIYNVRTDKFDEATKAFFSGYDTIPSKDLPIIKLLFKFLFIGLAGIYILGIFAGFYAPAVEVGYAFAIGNFVRVGYIVYKYFQPGDVWVMSGISNQQVGKICIIQVVLGVVIAGCTFLSSMDDDYQAFAAEMASAAAEKWDEDGAYCKVIFGMGVFFTIFQLPPVLAPGMAIKQFQPVEEKQATDKQSVLVVEFVMAFQALSILLTQALVAVFVWYMPSVTGLAIWCVIFYTLYYPIFVFCPVLLEADYYGMDRLPMMIFLIMNVFLGGMSFQVLDLF